MGYSMPNVIKEIYIPLSEKFLNTEPTLEEYKRKYGIDLEEVLGIHIVTGEIPSLNLPLNTKVYFVVEDYEDLVSASPMVAIPNYLLENSDENSFTIAFVTLVYNNGSLSNASGFGLIIKDDKTLAPFLV